MAFWELNNATLSPPRASSERSVLFLRRCNGEEYRGNIAIQSQYYLLPVFEWCDYR